MMSLLDVRLFSKFQKMCENEKVKVEVTYIRQIQKQQQQNQFDKVKNEKK